MNFIEFVYSHKDLCIEVVGILATVFIFISFTQSETKKIRLINSVGSVLFVVYGILLRAESVYIMNGAVLVLNIYKLVTYNKTVEYQEVKHAQTDGRFKTADIREIKISKK